MHYLSAEGISKSYGVQPLFEKITFHMEEGDKIALVARNGSGKSTLLKILAGKESPDAGTVWINKSVDVALFEQEPVFNESASVLDNIFFHDHPVINAIKEFEALDALADPATLNEAIMKMDDLGAWDFESRVKQILGKLQIHDLNQPVRNLSGGQRKRVALARTLIDIGFEHKHILLIMDEPTNHLDVEMVEWLENFLSKENLTLLLVTHDRYFLDAVCEEIWELDGSSLHVYEGDYQNYVEKKVARKESEASSIDKARNLYRKELDWMRRQPRARTTKSKSRQENFYEVEKLAKSRTGDQQLELQMQMSRLGGRIAELKKVYKQFGEKTILKGFDYTFKKGDRIGIIGKNGAGKSTFINILQGLEAPDSGKVNTGDTVVFGYYSQEGLVVKEDIRVIEFVKGIAENFPLAGGGSLSAAQFLQLFLFDPEKQYTYLSRLSGGEKRRLHLLSILFRNPNFLVLDEPTNDLDLPTLTVLEDFLGEFQGCLLIVSHDRYFMDRLVDHLFVFEGDGKISDFPGNYSQYRERQKELEDSGNQEKSRDTQPKTAVAQEGPRLKLPSRQLTFKEKREFESLEIEISRLAEEKSVISEKLNNPETGYAELASLSVRLEELSRIIDEKELRWLELSELA